MKESAVGPSSLRRRLVIAVTTAAVLISAAPPVAATPEHPQVTVMSRNLYLGADIAPALTSSTLDELVARASQVWLDVQASSFAQRADALAHEVQRTRPELIGLQEVALWRTDTPADGPATPAEDVALDFLEIFLEALEDRGLSYDAVSTVENFDGEVPTVFGYDVRYTDHDVILARSDVETHNALSGNFAVGIPLPALLGGGIVERGWTSVDATVAGSTFRFVNTHLEAFDVDIVRVAQTAELLATAAATALPVVLVGDLNTEPGTGPYNMLLSAGFVDAWSTPRPGPTCCQAADLSNRFSELDKRIDYVLVRGVAATTAHLLVGDTVGSRMRTGLWPSDHAGVVATVRL